ncbi:MAG: hypothetical protein WBG23_08645, partial [Acidobacteriaceae bacterium]
CYHQRASHSWVEPQTREDYSSRPAGEVRQTAEKSGHTMKCGAAQKVWVAIQTVVNRAETKHATEHDPI